MTLNAKIQAHACVKLDFLSNQYQHPRDDFGAGRQLDEVTSG